MLAIWNLTWAQGLVLTNNMVLVMVLSLGLVGNLPKGPRHHVFFDIFFTRLRLLKGLSDLGIAATGTTRSNGTGKCPIDTKALNKQKRGSFDF